MGQANVFYATDKDGAQREHGWLSDLVDRIEAYAGENLLDELAVHRSAAPRPPPPPPPA
jgi:hypothetical protein